MNPEWLTVVQVCWQCPLLLSQQVPVEAFQQSGPTRIPKPKAYSTPTGTNSTAALTQNAGTSQALPKLGGKHIQWLEYRGPVYKDIMNIISATFQKLGRILHDLIFVYFWHYSSEKSRNFWITCEQFSWETGENKIKASKFRYIFNVESDRNWTRLPEIHYIFRIHSNSHGPFTHYKTWQH